MKKIDLLYRELHDSLGKEELTSEFCCGIKKRIQQLIDEIPQGVRVGIRPAGGDTKSLLEQFDFSGVNIVGILDRSKKEDTFCGYPWVSMGEFSAEEYDCVIVFSNLYRKEILADMGSIDVELLDIYGELQKSGIDLALPFEQYQPYNAVVLNYFYLKCRKAKGMADFEQALRELLQAAVECKDFVMIQKAYEEYDGINGKFPILTDAWARTEKLLKEIQSQIQARKQNDIIVYYTDAVPYCMLDDLPYVKKLSANGTFFRRACTHTPFTNPTLRAMFRELLPIDDFDQTGERIDRTNSPLIQYLEEKGYRVRISGSETVFCDEYLAGEFYKETNCNILWWQGILDLLRSKRPCFYIFHFIAETHTPYYAPDLPRIEPNVYVKSTVQEAQARTSFLYMDRCLALFHRMTETKTEVFFSDHGASVREYQPWSKWKLHSYCFVIGDRISRQSVTRFFPYKKFLKFVQWLVEPERFSLEDACADEVIFQDVDFYNPKAIDQFIQQDLTKNAVSYRGILTYRYKYVINSLGEEFFFHMQEDGEEIPAELKDSELRQALQKKCGTRFLDIYRYDKFWHTRKLYDHIWKTNGAAILENMLED